MALARLLRLLLPAYGLEAEAQSLQLCALSTRRTLLLLLCNFATVHKIPTTKINSSWKELVPSSFLHFADLAWHNFWEHLESLPEYKTISENSVWNNLRSPKIAMLWMLWILNMKHFCWISNTVSVYNFSLHHHHLIIRNLKIVMFFFWTSPSSLFFQASRISHWTKLLLLLDSIFFLLLSKSS